MDYLKLIPVIMQLLNILPKIQEALAAKKNIFTILQQFAPELLPILSSIGGTMFPNLPKESAPAAGALIISPDLVRTVQSGLNRLKITDDSNAALVEDGSYGQRTKQAVAKFQKANGLVADGWAGSVTQTAIANEVAKLPAA